MAGRVGGAAGLQGHDHGSTVPAVSSLAASRRRGQAAGGSRATLTGALSEDGLDHYAVGMKDPEGHEFDIN
jgi:hypothetical protein